MSALNVRPLVEGAAVVLGLLGITWGMVAVGTSRPHPESVTRAELVLMQELIRSQNESLVREIRALRDIVITLRPIHEEQAAPPR